MNTDIRTFTPATDIVETDEAMSFYMNMPGVDQDHVTIKLENNMLAVHGDIYSYQSQGQKRTLPKSKIGNYSRSFHLADSVDHQNMTTTMNEGLLTLTLSKRPFQKVKVA